MAFNPLTTLRDSFREDDDFQIISTPDQPQPQAQAQSQPKNNGFQEDDDFQIAQPKKTHFEKYFNAVHGDDYEAAIMDEDYLERVHEQGMAQVARGLISGASAGISELVPGFETEGGIANEIYKGVGAALPITGLAKVFNNPLVNLAKKSPVAKKALTFMANITGSGLSGAVYGGTEQAARTKEMPSVSDVVEHGATWAALDTLLQGTFGAGRFAANLVKAAKKTGKPEFKLINDAIVQAKASGKNVSTPEAVAAKVMSELDKEAAGVTLSRAEQNQVKRAEENFVRMEQTRKAEQAAVERSENIAKERLIYEENLQKATEDLKNKKVSDETFSQIEKPELAEKYAPQEFEFVQVVDNAERDAVNTLKEDFAARAPNKTELGENIKSDAEATLRAAKEEYQPAYALAYEYAPYSQGTPHEVGKVATSTLKNIEGFKTKPAGYANVIKTLESVLVDSGFQINRDEAGRLLDVISTKNVSANELMELGKRVNEIIDYDVLEKTIKDSLRPVARAIKKEARRALANQPEALEMYETAERLYAETAEKFRPEIVTKIRQTQASEKIGDMIKSPSTLRDLKPVLSEPQMRQVEREIIEHIDTLSEGKARDYLREVRPFISEDARILADDVVRLKQPSQSPGRLKTIREKTVDLALNDLAASSITGERPKKALDLWKTKEGQQLIKHGLKDNPNREQVLKYLEDQSLNDMAKSVQKADGSIDFKELRKMMKDPPTVENIRLMGGEKAVQFYRNLEHLSHTTERNLNAMRAPRVKEIRFDEYVLKKFEQGEHLLKKTKESNNAKQIVPPKEKTKAEKIIESGNPKLTEKQLKEKMKYSDARVKEMYERDLKARKMRDYPLQYKMDQASDLLNDETKQILKALGILKLSVAVPSYIAYKLLYMFAKSPRARYAMEAAARSRTDPTALFTAFETLGRIEEND